MSKFYDMIYDIVKKTAKIPIKCISINRRNNFTEMFIYF